MKLLAAIGVLAMAELSCAATFVGQSYMGVMTSEGNLSRFPVNVVATTDYSTLDWTISWNIPATTVRGGPDQNIETRIGTRGSFTLRDPFQLGTPDASGFVTSNVPGYLTAPETIEFFGTYRDGSEIATWHTTTAVLFGDLLGQSLNIANYPASLRLSAVSRFTLTMSGTTSDGDPVSLTGNLFRGATGSTQGISSLLQEVLPGDFNSDGAVDAADYTVARDATSPVATSLADLNTWRQRYGSTSTATSAAVPEPTAPILATLAIVLTLAGTKSRK